MKSPAVMRTASLLRELARSDGVPVSVSELARRLVIPKSSVSNFCEALEASDFVERRGNGYVIAWGAAEVGLSYVSHLDPVDEFYRFWNKDDNVGFEHTVQLGVLLDGLEMMFVARRAGSDNIQLIGSIGRRLPASCTAAGKALLAALPERDLTSRLAGIERLPALTVNSQVNVEALCDELVKVRRSNRSFNDEETMVGVFCVGASLTTPELVAQGQVPIAVSMTAVKGQVTLQSGVIDPAILSRFDDLVQSLSPRLRPAQGI